MARDDFPKKIKDIVAKRAAYKCSNPGCNKSCIGPTTTDLDKIVYIGKVALLPQQLKISSTADDSTVMAVRHKKYRIEGLQFHPESIKMKPHGMKMLENFLK